MKVHACQHHHHPRGPAGAGDLYYPGLGNGGYNARHYDLDLKVDPVGNQVQGRATMEAAATENLDTFNLDFHGCQVDGVLVNGKPAAFAREEDELVITPADPLRQGEEFKVAVDYSGSPQAKTSVCSPFLVGWKHSSHGIVVDSQPDGAQTWLPVNDHPRDKATYSMKVEVPKPFVVAANGSLLGIEDRGENQAFSFATRDPMASYLATVNVGNYVLDQQEGAPVPIRNYFPPELVEKARYDFGRTPEMMDFFAERFGPYPFENYGVIVVNDPEAVSGAMETQTLSLFEPGLVTGDRANEDVVAHELAHHWFGNLVSVSQWRDLWLHEGFASYAEWLWLEHTEGTEALDKKAAKTRDWLERQPGITIGEPPKDDLFNGQVYIKGALALHELRKKVGDEAFFSGCRAYLSRHAGEGAVNPTIEDLQKVMEENSGQQLGGFFQDWLYKAELPA